MCRLRRRDRAGRPELGGLGRAGDDRRDGGCCLSSQRLGAKAEGSSNWDGGSRESWGRGRGELSRLARNGGPQTKLELCLCSTEERLVDCRSVGVEGDISGGRVGVALEDDLLVVADLKAGTKLQQRKSVQKCLRMDLLAGRSCRPK